AGRRSGPSAVLGGVGLQALVVALVASEPGLAAEYAGLPGPDQGPMGVRFILLIQRDAAVDAGPRVPRTLRLRLPRPLRSVETTVALAAAEGLGCGGSVLPAIAKEAVRAARQGSRQLRDITSCVI